MKITLLQYFVQTQLYSYVRCSKQKLKFLQREKYSDPARSLIPVIYSTLWLYSVTTSWSQRWIKALPSCPVHHRPVLHLLSHKTVIQKCMREKKLLFFKHRIYFRWFLVNYAKQAYSWDIFYTHLSSLPLRRQCAVTTWPVLSGWTRANLELLLLGFWAWRKH